MTVAIQKMTLADFLAYDDGTDNSYELEWVEGLYEEQMYTGDNLIVSPLLGNLDLTVDRVLQGR